MATDRSYLWVVEMRERGAWLPTVGVQLCRSDARRELMEWRESNPGDVYRLTRYARVKERS